MINIPATDPGSLSEEVVTVSSQVAKLSDRFGEIKDPVTAPAI
jgi:hypothetical protein